MKKQSIILSLCFVCALFATKGMAQNNLVLREDNIEAILKAMTIEEKVGLLVGSQEEMMPGAAGNTRPIPRLGIPMTILCDGPAGLNIEPKREGTDQTFYCTGFPTGTAMASSWDVALMEYVTTAMGNEVLEYGADVILAPWHEPPP